jgi:hypothetical protein
VGGGVVVRVVWESWTPYVGKVVVYARDRVIFYAGLNPRTRHWFVGCPAGPCFYSWHQQPPWVGGLLVVSSLCFVVWRMLVRH